MGSAPSNCNRADSSPRSRDPERAQHVAAAAGPAALSSTAQDTNLRARTQVQGADVVARLLIVDDDPMQRQTLTPMLRGDGVDEAQAPDDATARRRLRIAIPMHDIGKIATPDAILSKPGKLTAQEYEAMKQHAEISYRILSGSSSEMLQLAAEVARTHHERWDGGGYPHGLAGDEIPLSGRIVAIADVFDALTSKRCYKPAFPLDKTRAIMAEGRGHHFDPALLDLFWAHIDEFMAVRVKNLDRVAP